MYDIESHSDPILQQLLQYADFHYGLCIVELNMIVDRCLKQRSNSQICCCISRIIEILSIKIRAEM